MYGVCLGGAVLCRIWQLMDLVKSMSSPETLNYQVLLLHLEDNDMTPILMFKIGQVIEGLAICKLG
jgi:hypothetical protein